MSPNPLLTQQHVFHDDDNDDDDSDDLIYVVSKPVPEQLDDEATRNNMTSPVHGAPPMNSSRLIMTPQTAARHKKILRTLQQQHEHEQGRGAPAGGRPLLRGATNQSHHQDENKDNTRDNNNPHKAVFTFEPSTEGRYVFKDWGSPVTTGRKQTIGNTDHSSCNPDEDGSSFGCDPAEMAFLSSTCSRSRSGLSSALSSTGGLSSSFAIRTVANRSFNQTLKAKISQKLMTTPKQYPNHNNNRNNHMTVEPPPPQNPNSWMIRMNPILPPPAGQPPQQPSSLLLPPRQVDADDKDIIPHGPFDEEEQDQIVLPHQQQKEPDEEGEWEDYPGVIHAIHNTNDDNTSGEEQEQPHQDIDDETLSDDDDDDDVENRPLLPLKRTTNSLLENCDNSGSTASITTTEDNDSGIIMSRQPSGVTEQKTAGEIVTTNNNNPQEHLMTGLILPQLARLLYISGCNKKKEEGETTVINDDEEKKDDQKNGDNKGQQQELSLEDTLSWRSFLTMIPAKKVFELSTAMFTINSLTTTTPTNTRGDGQGDNHGPPFFLEQATVDVVSELIARTKALNEGEGDENDEEAAMLASTSWTALLSTLPANEVTNILALLDCTDDHEEQQVPTETTIAIPTETTTTTTTIAIDEDGPAKPAEGVEVMIEVARLRSKAQNAAQAPVSLVVNTQEQEPLQRSIVLEKALSDILRRSFGQSHDGSHDDDDDDDEEDAVGEMIKGQLLAMQAIPSASHYVDASDLEGCLSFDESSPMKQVQRRRRALQNVILPPSHHVEAFQLNHAVTFEDTSPLKGRNQKKILEMQRLIIPTSRIVSSRIIRVRRQNQRTFDHERRSPVEEIEIPLEMHLDSNIETRLLLPEASPVSDQDHDDNDDDHKETVEEESEEKQPPSPQDPKQPKKWPKRFGRLFRRRKDEDEPEEASPDTAVVPLVTTTAESNPEEASAAHVLQHLVAIEFTSRDEEFDDIDRDNEELDPILEDRPSTTGKKSKRSNKKHRKTSTARRSRSEPSCMTAEIETVFHRGSKSANVMLANLSESQSATEFMDRMARSCNDNKESSLHSLDEDDESLIPVTKLSFAEHEPNRVSSRQSLYSF